MWLALAAVGCSAPEPAAPPWADATRFSLLAVGDTGRNNFLLRAFDRQLSTALAMTTEHRARPVDALVLLGDNFYYTGLHARTIERQLRDNLVRPYCAFVELRGLLSARVADACGLPEAERRPVAIHAILGDHDYLSGESPALERRVVPRYVSNWRMPESDFEVVEFGSGLSLVLAESTPYLDGRDLAPLGEALRRARGPWRVLAIHRPVAHSAGETETQLLQAAVRAAGVPVQLFLSGDEHNLQVLRPPEGIGGLHVVAGGGSDAEEIEEPEHPFGLEAQGFARVDLAGDEAAPRLFVTLFSTPRYALATYFGAGREAVTRWSVDVSGAARSEPPSDAGDTTSRTR